jgi:hypothetical protein
MLGFIYTCPLGYNATALRALPAWDSVEGMGSRLPITLS